MRLAASQRSCTDFRAHAAARDAEVEKYQVGVCCHEVWCSMLATLDMHCSEQTRSAGSGRSCAAQQGCDGQGRFACTVRSQAAGQHRLLCCTRVSSWRTYSLTHATLQEADVGKHTAVDGNPYYGGKLHRDSIEMYDDHLAEPRNETPQGHADVDVQHCLVCCSNLRDTSLNCGHLVCKDCATQLLQCPCCRTPITKRSHVYV